MSTDHTKNVFQEFYSDLVNILPMDGETFMAELFTKELLPGDLKQSISAKETQAKKAAYFLDHAISPSVMGDAGESFKVLLEVMQGSDYPHLKNLAGKISEC